MVEYNFDETRSREEIDKTLCEITFFKSLSVRECGV